MEVSSFEQPSISGSYSRYLSAFLTLAQRAFWAAAILARAAADMCRFFGAVTDGVGRPDRGEELSVRSAFTCSRRSISESISARIWLVPMREVYRKAVHGRRGVPAHEAR